MNLRSRATYFNRSGNRVMIASLSKHKFSGHPLVFAALDGDFFTPSGAFIAIDSRGSVTRFSVTVDHPRNLCVEDTSDAVKALWDNIFLIPDKWNNPTIKDC